MAANLRLVCDIRNSNILSGVVKGTKPLCVGLVCTKEATRKNTMFVGVQLIQGAQALGRAACRFFADSPPKASVGTPQQYQHFSSGVNLACLFNELEFHKYLEKYCDPWARG